MTTRFSRRRAERILRGHPAGADPLAVVITAARAPGTAEELSDQDAAVAHFIAADTGAQNVSANNASAESVAATRAGWGSRFRVRLAVAATVATATITGLVAAAAAGILPARLQRPVHNIFHAPAAPVVALTPFVDRPPDVARDQQGPKQQRGSVDLSHVDLSHVNLSRDNRTHDEPAHVEPDGKCVEQPDPVGAPNHRLTSNDDAIRYLDPNHHRFADGGVLHNCAAHQGRADTSPTGGRLSQERVVTDRPHRAR